MTADVWSDGVRGWWIALSAISLMNLTLLGATGRRVAALGAEAAAERRARRRQLALSSLFVVGCAFRSFLPRAEGQRICLFDTWWSSAILSRTVATVAELALVTQWTLVLLEWSHACGIRYGQLVARALLPLIAGAEICSWYTTLTTNFAGSVIEESTWAVTSTLMTGTLLVLWLRHRPARRLFVGASIVLNTAYIVFMWSVDVPMYLGRHRTDTGIGKAYLSVADGFRDAASRRVVTRRWEDWRPEIPWMSLYFSAGVWISLALVRAPRFGHDAGS